MWRQSLGDSNGLSLATITKDEEVNTYTVTRRPSGDGGDETTRALWTEMLQTDGGADYLATVFVLGVQRARVAERRWAPPDEDSITFACGITGAEARSVAGNFPRGAGAAASASG